MARDYKAELATEKANHPERGAERAARNRARRKLSKKVGKAALKGKQVEHRNGRATDNRLGNLAVVTPRANNNGRRGGPAKGRK